MPRNKRLSELEIGKIEALKEEGKSIRYIARKIDRTHGVVLNYLKNPASYGKNMKKTGRKPKLTAKDKRRIGRTASNSTKSCDRIKRELGLNVDRTTVWRALNKNPNLKCQKMMKAPRLKPFHIEQRLQFAKTNMGKDWNLASFFN